jgi:hypothetical protein
VPGLLPSLPKIRHGRFRENDIYGMCSRPKYAVARLHRSKEHLRFDYLADAWEYGGRERKAKRVGLSD